MSVKVEGLVLRVEGAANRGRKNMKKWRKIL